MNYTKFTSISFLFLEYDYINGTQQINKTPDAISPEPKKYSNSLFHVRTYAILFRQPYRVSVHQISRLQNEHYVIPLTARSDAKV